MKSLLSIVLSGVSLAALAGPVSAQTAPSGGKTSVPEASPDQDIIVIGTLIRGTAPTGSQTIKVDAKTIAEKGATSTNELLSLIPQISNTFNGRFEADPRGVSAGISITKPNLRNLPSANTSSSATTLVLMNGNRLAPIGVNQAAVDVDIIPSAVLEGIEAVTDGGSSLYGADAVAGVLNFRTMKKFEGLKIDANLGSGTTVSGFKEWDAAGTAGKSWSGGNAYISVGHSHRDNILNGQVPWSSALVYTAAGVPSYSYTQCTQPVGTLINYKKYGPGATQWTSNPLASGAGTVPVGTACDQKSAESYSPEQTRTNVFGSLTQRLADNVDLSVTAYWTKRDTVYSNYAQGYTTPAQTPVFPAGAAVGTIYTVRGGTGFAFDANAAYVNKPSLIGFETWQIAPEVTVRLKRNWQVRNALSYGQSVNTQRLPGVDSVKTQSYIDSGQLDPLNVGAASAAVITDATNYESDQDTKQGQVTFRSTADGPVFALAGGDAKVAVGVEYQGNSAKSRLNAGPAGSLDAVPYKKSTRNAKSIFAEVSLPLASFVDATGSVRYDNYSDFGGTTNPNLGLSLKPVSSLKIFGHWNTSFNAPTALDGLAIATGRYVCGLYVAGSTDPTKRPTDPLGRDTSKQGTCAFVLQGSSPNLKPQTATSWAVGFEFKPVSNLRLGGEFYAIDFKNVLGSLNPSNESTYTTNPDLYTYNVSSATFNDTLGQLTNGTTLGTQKAYSDIAIIVDTRTTNLNAAKVEGIDFHANVDTRTGFGGVAFGLNGNLMTRNLVTNGGVTTNELGHGSARLTVASFIAVKSGPATARVSVNYTGKYHDLATNYLGVSEDVDPFVTTNVNFGYEVPDGPLAGSSFRVSADNLFEVSPQTIKRTNTNNLSYNNWTLGRVIKFGFSAKF